MEMNPEQHQAVMFQAIAHNLSTVDRDVDLLIATLSGRSDITPEQLASVKLGQEEAHRAYANFLALYTEACGAYAADENGHINHSPALPHSHDNGHTHGNERDPLSVVEAAYMFTEQAHPYETR